MIAPVAVTVADAGVYPAGGSRIEADVPWKLPGAFEQEVAAFARREETFDQSVDVPAQTEL